MTDELHKKVLGLLGFEVKHTERGNWWVWLNSKWYQVETKSGFMTPVWAVTEDAAWAQVPTLDALMTPLMAVMMSTQAESDGSKFEIQMGFVFNKYHASLISVSRHGVHVAIKTRVIHSTIAEAIAALFVAGVAREKVNPATVVLP